MNAFYRFLGNPGIKGVLGGALITFALQALAERRFVLAAFFGFLGIFNTITAYRTGAKLFKKRK